MKVDRYELQGTADQLLERLEAAQGSDKEAERLASRYGKLAIVGFVGAFVGILLLTLLPLAGVVLLGVGLPLGVFMFVLRSRHMDDDLDDRKLATAVQFLRIIRADTPPHSPVSLTVDFRDYQLGGDKLSEEVVDPGFFGSNVKVKKYRHDWFEVSGTLADGTRYHAVAGERIGRKEKPKRKYTKVKQRDTGALSVRLKLKPERYGPAAPVAATLQKLAPPHGMHPRTIKANGQTLGVEVATDPCVTVRARCGTTTPEVGHEVTGNSLLTVFLWIYDAVARGAQRRTAA